MTLTKDIDLVQRYAKGNTKVKAKFCDGENPYVSMKPFPVVIWNTSTFPSTCLAWLHETLFRTVDCNMSRENHGIGMTASIWRQHLVFIPFFCSYSWIFMMPQILSWDKLSPEILCVYVSAIRWPQMNL